MRIWDLAEDSKFYLISMNILISYVLGNLWTITGRSYMSITFRSKRVKSDSHVISPHTITPESNVKVM